MFGWFNSSVNELSLEKFKRVHRQLVRHGEFSTTDLVELLRQTCEFVVYGDQNRDEQLFEFFCEKNFLRLFVEIAAGSGNRAAGLQIQLLQSVSMILENLRTPMGLYYVLSNNYINQLISFPHYYYNDNEEVRDWYITFLKALSQLLNQNTIHFFFNNNSFPLYTQAIRFFKCPEIMVNIAVKTITLNVYKIKDEQMHSFILNNHWNYFEALIDYGVELAMKLQGLLNQWRYQQKTTLQKQTEQMGSLMDQYIDYYYYLQDILDVDIPKLSYKLGELIYSKLIRSFLVASFVPNCQVANPRISCVLSLSLLSHFFTIFSHTPILNAVCYLLLYPENTDDCMFSVAALGSDGKRKKSRCKSNVEEEKSSHEEINKPTSPKSSTNGHLFEEICLHVEERCVTPICYLQTRYDSGEWPKQEVVAFSRKFATQFQSHSNDINIFRESINALSESRNDEISYGSLLLLCSILNNTFVSKDLLNYCNLLPQRKNRIRQIFQSLTSNDESNAMQACISPSVLSPSSQTRSPIFSSDSSASSDEEEGESNSSKSEEEEINELIRSDSSYVESQSSTWRYSNTYVDRAFGIIIRANGIRLVNLQLAMRFLLDIVLDARTDSPYLSKDHVEAFKIIHSNSAKDVQSVFSGSLSDFFLFLFEEEYQHVKKTAFPMKLSNVVSDVKTLIPIEDSSIKHINLVYRLPKGDTEKCRHYIQVFLWVVRLRQKLGLLTKSSAHETMTSIFEKLIVDVDDDNKMEFILQKRQEYMKCIWRDQRFEKNPIPLYFLYSKTDFLLVEPDLRVLNKVIVQCKVPIHRVYAVVDQNDSRVLHLSFKSQNKIRHAIFDNTSDAWRTSVIFLNASSALAVQLHLEDARLTAVTFKTAELNRILKSFMLPDEGISAKDVDVSVIEEDEGVKVAQVSAEGASTEEMYVPVAGDDVTGLDEGISSEGIVVKDEVVHLEDVAVQDEFVSVTENDIFAETEQAPTEDVDVSAHENSVTENDIVAETERISADDENNKLAIDDWIPTIDVDVPTKDEGMIIEVDNPSTRIEIECTEDSKMKEH